MKKINILIMVSLLSLAFLIQSASALTANSDNFSVNMFGTGEQASNPSSDNYQAQTLTLTEAATRNAENDQVTANIGFFDNTSYYISVSIVSYSISSRSSIIGSTIGLYISALNYQSVWAKITSPNSQEQRINLINGQTVNYLPSPSVVGRYNVVFYANSSSGAITSAVDYFDLTSQSTPAAQSPGGGGGPTTIIEKCVYIWDCSPWSLCSNGNQTRECANTGNCTGTEGKPIEERICSDALFDVILKSKEIQIKNQTLNFGIDLTETKGIEKIDVQIKYSIIDSKNNEIFSQIETRAIKGSLSYQKEIKGIDLADGEYTLRIDVIYGNSQKAFTEQKFNILSGKTGNISNINYLLAVIISLVLFSIYYSVSIFLRTHHKEKLVKLIESKAKLLYPIFGLLALGFLVLILRLKITGEAISNISSSFIPSTLFWIIGIILILAVLLIIFRKKLDLSHKFKSFLSEVSNKFKKYPSNSIKGLINKKVYSESGHYIGKIIEVNLIENKIDDLKIKTDKKYKPHAKGIIIEYKHVKSSGEIILINDKILEHLEK